MEMSLAKPDPELSNASGVFPGILSQSLMVKREAGHAQTLKSTQMTSLHMSKYDDPCSSFADVRVLNSDANEAVCFVGRERVRINTGCGESARPPNFSVSLHVTFRIQNT